MRPFFEWFSERGFRPEEPWLVFGKGPSFARRHEFDTSGFKTLSLNHAVRDQPVTLAHVIDADVLNDCGDAVERNADALVMPWVPHVKNAAGEETLDDLMARLPLLRRLSEQGRLLWYNLLTAPQPHGDSPVVSVRWFSIEAVLNLLAMAGVRRVRSLGVDGGATYSGEFDDLKEKTLLANGHESFDRQFAEIAKIIGRTGIDYSPLDVEAPVRVYVGTLEEQMLAVKVLEFSIRKHASVTVEVFPLHLAPVSIPSPKDERNAPRTPFSFQRFLIPELAGYRGRAIYVDSDMQVFKDIRRLWTLPFNGADLLAVSKPGDSERRPQFSVMLLDCEALKWDVREIVAALDREDLQYEGLMQGMEVARNVRADISPVWNSLEHYEEGRTALLHYTDMPTQPWVSLQNPFGHVWVRDLFEAIDSGFITLDYVRDHVARGGVRPSLVYQIEHRIEDCLHLPLKACALDARFVAPYESLLQVDGHSRHRDPFGLRARWKLGLARARDLSRMRKSISYRTKLLLGHLKD